MILEPQREVRTGNRDLSSYLLRENVPSYQSIGADSGNGIKIVYCVHGDHVTTCRKGCNGDSTVTSEEILQPVDHCHVEREQSVDRKARRQLITASVLCVVFMTGEAVGGILANSLAIATDAAHLLTDFASFMISLFSLWVATRPATTSMSFGWYRAEVMGALISVLFIWVVTGVLVYIAVQRVISMDFAIDATIMLITSAAGLVVNLIMGCSLHQHGHSHGGHSGHSHTDQAFGDVEKAKRVNINVRAAFIHVIGDFIQSLGVFVAALIIFFKPSWVIIDPICTFLFSVLVLFTTVNILRDVVNVLMEGRPRGINFQDVQQLFLQIEGVKKVHNLRIWALSLDKPALAAHLAIDPSVRPQVVLAHATRLIRSRYDFFEMTLQIEDYLDQMSNCSQCQSLSE